MRKKTLGFVFGLVVALFYSYVFADENITLTTYYPSPYGSYNTLSVTNTLKVGASAQNTWSTDQGGAIELGGTNSVANPVIGGIPYIDFHYGTGTVQDFNMRIINDQNGRLSVYGGCLNATMCSDAAFKTNIQPLDMQVLDRVLQLHASTYEWKDSTDGKRYIGFIAQDVEKVFPEVVTTPADKPTGKGLECTGLNAIAIEAIKELSGRVAQLETEVKTLKNIKNR